MDPDSCAKPLDTAPATSRAAELVTNFRREIMCGAERRGSYPDYRKRAQLYNCALRNRLKWSLRVMLLVTPTGPDLTSLLISGALQKKNTPARLCRFNGKPAEWHA